MMKLEEVNIFENKRAKLQHLQTQFEIIMGFPLYSSGNFDCYNPKRLFFCSPGLKEHRPQHTVTVGRNASAKRWLLARKLPALICCTGYLPPQTWWPPPTAGKNTVGALAIKQYLQYIWFLTWLYVFVICISFLTLCFCPPAGESIYCCFSCRLLPGRVLSTVSTDHHASERTGTARRPIRKVIIRLTLILSSL